MAGAKKSDARFVIIDATGVRSFNTDALAVLGRVARGLRLLGAETILTGLHADAGRQLATQLESVMGFTTMSTLKAGMEYAQVPTDAHVSQRVDTGTKAGSTRKAAVRFNG